MKEKETIKGEYYTHNTIDHPYNIYIRRKGFYHIYPDNQYVYVNYDNWEGGNEPINMREATWEEIKWLEACVEAREYVTMPILNYEIY